MAGIAVGFATEQIVTSRLIGGKRGTVVQVSIELR
jgi:hypothetical protein